MKSYLEFLSESKKPKPSFGNSDGKSYAVNLSFVDSNDYYKQPFGRKMADMKKVVDFMKKSKKSYIDTKGKPTLSAVKKWVKEENPKEFYAMWKSDSTNYKDDSVEIFYK